MLNSINRPSDRSMARPDRATRGKRLSKLVDEEIEADEEFWNQDAFKEEGADDEYEEEQEIADEFDSDFNDEEDESDDGEAEEKESRPKRKKTLPPGKKPLKKGPSGSHKKKGVSFLEEAAAAADAGEALPTSDTPRPAAAAVRPSAEEKEDEEGEKSLRKSTRTSVVVKQAEREAQRAIQQALPKIVKKKKEGEEKKMTQEEMLLEAAQTEIQNRQSLETLLAREEEVKRKAIINKEVYSGPLVRFYSKGGVNILEFVKMAGIPAVISAKALPYPKQPICVVTGLPAKYRDPKSGHPYATKEAFAILRERLRKGGNLSRDDSLEKVQRKRTRVEREKSAPGSRMGSVKIKFKKPERPKPSEEPKPQNPPAQPEPAEPLKQQPKPAPRPPAPPLPRPMVEANEADFMLEDLEVSLPSNFDSGLMTSGEHVMNLSPTERYDLPMDAQSSHLLLDDSWLHNT